MAYGEPVLAANNRRDDHLRPRAVVTYTLMRTLAVPGRRGVAPPPQRWAPCRSPGSHVIQYPTWYLALVLLAAVRAERGGRYAWVTAAVTIAVFSSYYIAAMTAALIGAESVVAWWTRGRRAALRLVAAATPGFVLLGAFSLPYLHAPIVQPDEATFAPGS